MVALHVPPWGSATRYRISTVTLSENVHDSSSIETEAGVVSVNGPACVFVSLWSGPTLYTHSV